MAQQISTFTNSAGISFSIGQRVWVQPHLSGLRPQPATVMGIIAGLEGAVVRIRADRSLIYRSVDASRVVGLVDNC